MSFFYFKSIIFAFLYFLRSYKLHRQCQRILCLSQIHFIKAYSITMYSWRSIPNGQSIPLKMLLVRHPILCLILCTCVKTYFQPWSLPLIPLEISFEYHVLHSHGRKTSLSTPCPKSWEGPYICHNRRHQFSPFYLLCQQLIYCSWWRVSWLHLRLVEHCAQLRSTTLNSMEICTSMAIYAGLGRWTWDIWSLNNFPAFM